MDINELSLMRVVTALSSAMLILLFLSCMIYPDKLYGLDGTVGILDHGGLYDTMSFPFRELYYVADYTCHQQSARSFILFGSQMAFCVRETSLLIGVAVGCIALEFIRRMQTKSLLIVAVALMPWTFVEMSIKGVYNNLTLCSITSIFSGAGASIALFCILRLEFKYVAGRTAGNTKDC